MVKGEVRQLCPNWSTALDLKSSQGVSAIPVSIILYMHPLSQRWKEARFRSLRSQQGVLSHSVKPRSFNAACWWKNREYTLLHSVTSGLLAFITFFAFMMCAVKKKKISCEWKSEFAREGYEMWRGSTAPSAAPKMWTPAFPWNQSPSQFIH